MISKGMNLDTGNKTWLTPPNIINALGKFDLDPCCPSGMPWRTAETMICQPQNGLDVDWWGKRVWLNPPYGREARPFLERMHYGIAFLYGRTDTKAFHELIFPRAKCIMFLRGRIKFMDIKGNASAGQANAPSVLIAYTEFDKKAIMKSNLDGWIMESCHF